MEPGGNEITFMANLSVKWPVKTHCTWNYTKITYIIGIHDSFDVTHKPNQHGIWIGYQYLPVPHVYPSLNISNSTSFDTQVLAMHFMPARIYHKNLVPFTMCHVSLLIMQCISRQNEKSIRSNNSTFAVSCHLVKPQSHYQ